MCGVLGALLTFGMAWLASACSLGPVFVRGYSTGNDHLDYILEVNGFGYRSLEIRVYDRRTSDVANRRLLSRQFQTELGWPRLMLKTSSARVGARKIDEPDHPSVRWRDDPAWRWRLEVEEMPPDETNSRGRALAWEIIWSGFILNWLVFTLPLLALVLWRTRAAAPLALAAAVGLWMTILVAWGGYANHEWGPIIDIESWGSGPSPPNRNVATYYTTDPAEFAQRGWPLNFPADGTDWNSFQGLERRSLGYHEWKCMFFVSGSTPVVSRSSPDGVAYIDIDAILSHDESIYLGAPFHSFQGDRVPLIISFVTPAQRFIQVMQIPVRWPGLIADWMFYTTVILLIWRGPRLMRRWWRCRHGRCTACGYPIGQSPVCSECGQAIPHAQVISPGAARS